MSQLQALLTNMLEQGFLFTFLGLGVLLTFRFFRFPDLTAEGSYPLGGAVAAARMATALVHTKLRINNIISGIIVMTALYTVNLRVMGRANVSLLSASSIVGDVAAALQDLGIPAREDAVTTIAVTAVLIAFVGLALIAFLHTDLGLAIRATGENETMIRSLGVNTDTTKLIGLAISNGAIALSGALVAQNHGFADIGMGIGILVTGAAAVLIGEAIFGDRSIERWVVSAVVGVLIYRFLVALALRVGFEPVDLRLITAALLLGALAVPQLRGRILRK